MLTESFRREIFEPIGTHTGLSGFAELLSIREDAEGFFASASISQIHQVFAQAVRNSVMSPITINIQPSALFDRNFLPLLLSELENLPNINHHNFCIEITEHGGVPENFNHKLLDLLREMGLKLALDDFDPRNDAELNRLELFSPYMDIIKFPYQVMEALRDPKSQKEVSDKIRSICEEHPDKIFVMEGIGKNEPDSVKQFLRDLGIDYIQVSAYQTRIQSASVHALALAG